LKELEFEEEKKFTRGASQIFGLIIIIKTD